MKYLVASRSLLFLFAFVLCVFSCKKDDVTDETGESINNNPAEFTLNLNAYKGERISIKAVFVKVADELGSPIESASVNAGGSITSQTDQKGLAIFKEVNAYKNFFMVKISKAGYVSTVKTIFPSNSELQVIEAVLLKPDIEKQVNSGEKISISTPSGAKVELTGNYFKPDGSSYSGIVNVSLKHLSPQYESTYDYMPGNLLAQNSDGQVKLLETYGMLSVELTSVNDEPLNIDANNKAVITLPIAIAQQGMSDTDIPLWYFDEDKGVWVEENKAIKDGANYVGEVSHFTWWNCDVPINLVNMCLTVADSDGKVLTNQNVKIIRNTTGQIIFNGLTNSEGKVCGAIPKNENINVDVFSGVDCLGHNIYFQRDIGQFNEEENEIKIIVEDEELNENVVVVEVKGRLNTCDSKTPISSSGFLELDYANQKRLIDVKSDGSFVFSIIGCENDKAILTGFDIQTRQSSVPKQITISNKTLDLGEVLTCEEYGERVYRGSITIETQQELDAFGAWGFTRIEGNLELGHQSGGTGNINTELRDLSGLISLTSVSGRVEITGYHLTSLTGLNNLREVGDLEIETSNLTTLEGLNSLEKVGHRLSIWNNLKLKNFNGLNNLTHIGRSLDNYGSLGIHNNRVLENIDALESLVSAHISISNHYFLKSIHGIRNLEEGGFGINMPSLTELPVFENLKNAESIVIDDTNLTSLQGLSNLEEIDYLSLTNNRVLSTLTGFENLKIIKNNLNIDSNLKLNNLSGLDNLSSIGEDLIIKDNPVLKDINGLSSLSNTINILQIDGNLLLESLSGLNRLKEIRGFCTIKDNSLVNLEGLNSLELIEGNFNLTNSTITSFEGLENLNLINGEFNIISTDVTNLKGLENLVSVEKLTVSRNSSIINFEGLSKLESSIHGLLIENNLNLKTLEGIEKLTYSASGGSVKIIKNESLISLKGMDNFKNIGGSFRIEENNSLIDLTGLLSLNSIGYDLEIYSNESLETLNGFDNLNLVSGDLRIRNNSSLSNFCDLKPSLRGAFYIVEGNKYNPTKVQLSSSDECSQ